MDFRIDPPAASIASLNPPAITAGASAFTLRVNGVNFVSGAVMQWNGKELPTTFAGTTQLTAAVPLALVAAPGIAVVTVVNRERPRRTP